MNQRFLELLDDLNENGKEMIVVSDGSVTIAKVIIKNETAIYNFPKLRDTFWSTKKQKTAQLTEKNIQRLRMVKTLEEDLEKLQNERDDLIQEILKR